MIQYRSLQRLLLTLLLVAPACSPNGLGQMSATGSVRFRVALPPATGFGTQEIPNATKRIKISISGEGLEKAKEETMNLADCAENKCSVEELPLGPKTVKVTAFDDKKGLAAASADKVEIKAGETTSVSVELQSILKSLTLSLQQPMPLDLQLQAEISGSNIDGALAETKSLQQGKTSVTYEGIPTGDKQVSVRIAIPLSNQDAFTSAPIQKPFAVKQTNSAVYSEQLSFSVTQVGDGLTLTLRDIFQAFKASMQSGEFFRKVPSDKVKVLVALVPREMLPEIQTGLLTLPPDQLRQLQDIIPAELFSQFPQLSDLIKRLLNPVIPTARPTTPPIAQPTPRPGATPTVPPPAAPSEFKIEISGAELTFNPPGLPIRREVSKLPDPPAAFNVVQTTRLFSATIRYRYNGTDVPVLKAKITNLDNPADPVNFFPLTSATISQAGVFQARIPFGTLDGIPMNNANKYRIDYNLTADQNRIALKGEYLIQVNPLVSATQPPTASSPTPSPILPGTLVESSPSPTLPGTLVESPPSPILPGTLIQSPPSPILPGTLIQSSPSPTPLLPLP